MWIISSSIYFYSKYTVKVSIESTSEQETAEACKKLLEMIPAEVIVTAEERTWNLCDEERNLFQTPWLYYNCKNFSKKCKDK